MSTTDARLGFDADRARSALFALLGLAFLGLAAPASIEPMTFWTGIVLGDYPFATHELHHLILGATFPILLLGVIVQVSRPRRRVAALHTSLVVWAALTVVFAVGGGFSPMHLVLLALLVGMVVAHPAGRSQRPSLDRLDRLDRPLLAMAAITSLGALAFAVAELGTHYAVSDAHVAFDHYLFMATAAVSVAVLAPYAAFRPIGWRYPAYALAFLLVVMGVGSVLFPGAEQGSSLGLLGLPVVVWAILFVAVAERARIRSSDT